MATTTQLLRGIQQARSPRAILDSVQAPSLRAALGTLLARSDESVEVMAGKMGITRVFLYQILSGRRRPGRDTLLKFGFIMGVSVEEMQRLLAIAAHGTLYPRVRRDAALLFGLSHGLTLAQMDELLIAEAECALITDVK